MIDFDTMKPLNSGHLQVLKNLSVTERCPLLGGNLYLGLSILSTIQGMSANGRFHCISMWFQVNKI